MSKANLICGVCGVELTDENWHTSHRKRNYRICKKCSARQRCLWAKANPEKAKVAWTKRSRKMGMRPFNENKECPQYLGIHVAERVLSKVFNNVKRMPMNNPGYDIICNHEKLIDIKSSCPRKDGVWQFAIKRNTMADYFLCLAFNNRKDLNPLHIWLIPGSKVNHLKQTGIRPSTIHRWDEYKLDISKISACCDAIR